MLVSVGESKSKKSCEAIKAAIEASGENKGNAKLDANAGGADYVSGKVANMKMEGETSVVTVTAESGESAEVHDCSTAYVKVNRERLRKLAIDEAHGSRRRLAVGIDDDRKPLDVGCAVFHCFEGDAKCANPSPRDACADWDKGANVCREPLCAYVLD